MSRWVAQVRERSSGELEIFTDLEKADPCLHEPIIGALAAHLGFEIEPMRLAIDPQPDPRYPWLATLVRSAQTTWELMTKRFVGRLLTMMGPYEEEAFRDAFEEHTTSVSGTFSGRAEDPRLLADLIRRGEVPEDDLVSVSFRLGRGLDFSEPHRYTGQKSPRFDNLVRQARGVELTEEDRHALLYAQRRAGIYMRAPAQAQVREAERLLSQYELKRVREAVASAVATGASSKQLEADLREHVDSPRLSNDMDRVAVTELHFAHSHGAHMALKAQIADAGISDPEVYKITGPRACDDCRRIWGTGGSERYRLSHVEARDAAGGNHGLPRQQWGPVIGPVHPRCTEGPLQMYTPQLADAIQDTVDEMMDLFGE